MPNLGGITTPPVCDIFGQAYSGASQLGGTGDVLDHWVDTISGGSNNLVQSAVGSVPVLCDGDGANDTGIWIPQGCNSAIQIANTGLLSPGDFTAFFVVEFQGFPNFNASGNFGAMVLMSGGNTYQFGQLVFCNSSGYQWYGSNTQAYNFNYALPSNRLVLCLRSTWDGTPAEQGIYLNRQKIGTATYYVAGTDGPIYLFCSSAGGSMPPCKLIRATFYNGPLSEGNIVKGKTATGDLAAVSLALEALYNVQTTFTQATLFLGDSKTFGNGTGYQTTGTIRTGRARNRSRAFLDRHPEHLVTNIGTPSQAAYDLNATAPFAACVTANLRPGMINNIVIQFGFNDVNVYAHSVTVTASDIEGVCLRAAQAGFNVRLCTMDAANAGGAPSATTVIAINNNLLTLYPNATVPVVVRFDQDPLVGINATTLVNLNANLSVYADGVHETYIGCNVEAQMIAESFVVTPTTAPTSKPHSGERKMSGQVGILYAADGSNPANAPRLGQHTEAIVQQAGGKYYEPTSRQAVYSAHTSAGRAGTALGVTPPILLYNPVGSGKRLKIMKVSASQAATGTLGTGVLSHCAFTINGPVGNQSNVIPVVGSGASITPKNNDIGGPSASVATVFEAGTLNANPVLLYPFANLSEAAGGTIAGNSDTMSEDVDGAITIEPGAGWCLEALAAAGSSPLIHVGVVWEEIGLAS